MKTIYNPKNRKNRKSAQDPPGPNIHKSGKTVYNLKINTPNEKQIGKKQIRKQIK